MRDEPDRAEGALPPSPQGGDSPGVFEPRRNARGMLRLSPLNRRRWRNFRRNGRAFWSLVIFSVIFTITLCAEFVANDKPILIQYRGEFYAPIFPVLSRDGVRRRFPDRGDLSRPGGAMPDRLGRAG